MPKRISKRFGVKVGIMVFITFVLMGFLIAPLLSKDTSGSDKIKIMLNSCNSKDVISNGSTLTEVVSYEFKTPVKNLWMQTNNCCVVEVDNKTFALLNCTSDDGIECHETNPCYLVG